MFTQSTHLGCSCAWVLAFIQSHKLVQFTPMQKPHKHYNESRRLRPFELCREERTPLCTHVYVLAHRMHQKPVDFFPKNLLYVHVSGDFHTLGPFPERAVVFQQRPSNQIGRTCPTFGVKMSTKRNRSFTIKDIGYILSHFSQTYFHCLYDLKTSVFQVQ